MNDMLNSLEGFDSGSNYKFGDKMERPNVKRSLFDLSHLSTMTIDNAGLLIPVTMWRTLPGDDFDINVDALLRVMPQVVPLYSRQRLYMYGFYSRLIDLWNNAQVFLSKGYTGNVQKKIPQLLRGVNVKYTDILSDTTVQPNTILDYLGLPIGSNIESLFGTSNTPSENTSTAGISALPFMMYLRIYRDYFMNKNEWINDRVILPDDDSRFRLNDNGELLSAKDLSKTMYFYANHNNSKYDLQIKYGNNEYTMGLLFHDYPDDKFTSALPFTQRGDTPTMKASNSKILSDIALNFSNSDFFFKHVVPSLTGEGMNVGAPGMDGLTMTDKPFTVNQVGDSGSLADEANTRMIAQLQKGKIPANTPISIATGITLNDIRELAIKQIELEKMARTDGSYKQFGLTFFGESSRAAYDFRPTYIGGTYKNIVFTEVLQNAPAGENQTPLGTYAGHGITGISNGRIGHIHCDDYGIVMIIACIMPDVYYHQGLDKILTDSLESDMYKPERAKLGLVPILNKELYYAGNNGNSEGDDNYLWAYQNPFDDYRYMENKIHGKIADSSNSSFFPYTQARHFNSLPNWGRNFSEAKDVRKDYLFASSSESAYTAQFSMNIRAVRPIPYKADPANIIN